VAVIGMRNNALVGEYKRVVNSFEDKWWEIVERWALLNNEYARRTGDDIPAWYVENLNSALFAAAAWQCDVPALCELDVLKQKAAQSDPDGNEESESSNGRVDLALYIGQSQHWIEAKSDYHSVDSATKNDQASCVKAKLCDAVVVEKKLIQAPDYENAKTHAAVFFRRTLPDEFYGNGKNDDRREKIDGEISALEKQFAKEGQGIAVYACSREDAVMSPYDCYRLAYFGFVMTI